MPLVSVDAENIPLVHTKDGSGLVSDSGFTRYRMEYKIWEIYSNKGDGYWYFPEGIYVEQFDSLHNVIGSIVADTAYNFEKKGLWQAIGNVAVKNIEGTTFETSELFWDRKAPANSNNAFYTNKRVKITNADGTIQYGDNGFKSDQSMKSLYFFSFSGAINIEESPDTLRQNPNPPDSIQNL